MSRLPSAADHHGEQVEFAYGGGKAAPQGGRRRVHPVLLRPKGGAECAARLLRVARLRRSAHRLRLRPGDYGPGAQNGTRGIFSLPPTQWTTFTTALRTGEL